MQFPRFNFNFDNEMSALEKLGEDYLSSSNSSDDEIENTSKRKNLESPEKSTKRSCVSREKTSQSFVEKDATSQVCPLPVPSELISMFEADDEHCEDPSDHDGRLRSFPHQRGNWATHIYITSTFEEIFSQLVDQLMRQCKELTPTKDFHVSLSKTVTLKYHWINLFVTSLKKKVQSFKKSVIYFDSLALYVNEEESRTFLSLKITSDKLLKDLTESVNEALKEFQLPDFYKEPSFHLTIGWCLGNRMQQLTAILPTLQESFHNFCEEEEIGLPFIKVNEIWCKTGNKSFAFPLS